jgi:hypothetical protein
MTGALLLPRIRRTNFPARHKKDNQLPDGAPIGEEIMPNCDNLTGDF